MCRKYLIKKLPLEELSKIESRMKVWFFLAKGMSLVALEVLVFEPNEMDRDLLLVKELSSTPMEWWFWELLLEDIVGISRETLGFAKSWE